MNKINNFNILAGSFSALGYTISVGWISPNVELLQSDQTHLTSGPLSNETLSWVTSIINIGGLIGSVFYGVLADYIGRRKTLILIAIPLIASWIMVAVGTTSIELLISRFLNGFGGGGVFVGLPMYIAEVVYDEKRGFFASFLPLSHGTGILTGFIVGSYCHYLATPILAIVLQVAFIAAFIYLPETPQFLFIKNKVDESRKSLRFFRSKETEIEFEKEFELLKENMIKRVTSNEKVTLSDFSK